MRKYNKQTEKTPAARMKEKFRRSEKWQMFREYMFQKQNGKDFLTGMPLRKGWNLHHCDLHKENYQILDDNNFYCLGSQSHDFVHWFYNYYKKDPSTILRLSVIMQKMKDLQEAEVKFE